MSKEPYGAESNRVSGSGSETGVSAGLQSLINSCNDVDEFRGLLQNHGIWLNHRAAETTFHALRGGRNGKLDDDALDVVVGGMTVLTENGDFLKELLNCLT